MSSSKDLPLPGLDLLVASCGPPNPTPFMRVILPVHWAIIRANNRLVVEEEEEGSSTTTTELLPQNWSTEMIKSDEWNTYILLNYRNQLTKTEIEIKILEIEENDKVAVSRRQGDAIMLRAKEFLINISGDRGKQSGEGAGGYKNLGKLEANVRNLFNDEEKKIVEEEKQKSPYDSNLSKEQLDRIEEAKRRRRRAAAAEEEEEKASVAPRHPPNPSPLFIPPRMPSADPFRIGHSDLDPFSGINAGGMLMDPSGFRRNRGMLPGGVGPPRFDPFGPIGGGGFRGPSMPLGGPSPSLPFGGPDNDLERMPTGGGGYDDMFM